MKVRSKQPENTDIRRRCFLKLGATALASGALAIGYLILPRSFEENLMRKNVDVTSIVDSVDASKPFSLQDALGGLLIFFTHTANVIEPRN